LMRFISDWRPLYAALELLDDLVLEGPLPDDIAARLDAWSDDNAEPGMAVELCVNGERYHATDAMLEIVTDLWLYRAIGHCRVTH
jgi:hypothetical protein